MALIGLCGCIIFVIIVCILHFLRPDKNPLSFFVSEYAVGKVSWLMTFGFYTLAIAVTSLLIGLLQQVKITAIAIITVGIFSMGILLAGIFPTDVGTKPPTVGGLIHGFAALVALASLAISMMALGMVFKRSEGWRKFASPSIFYGIVSLVLLIVFIGSPISFRGATQRLLLVWDISWLMLVSWKLYRHIITAFV